MILFPRYAGLIFDCDGTLTDSMPIHYVAWVKAMTRYGIDFPETRFYELGGVPTAKIIELLAGEQGITVDVEKAGQDKEDFFFANLTDVRANAPVCDIARNHHRKLPMAVASGGSQAVVRDQLASIQMIDFFQSIVAAEDTTLHKPHPDVFLEAAKRISIKPNACLVFEDTDIGIEAACRAGMDYIDVRKLDAGPQPRKSFS